MHLHGERGPHSSFVNLCLWCKNSVEWWSLITKYGIKLFFCYAARLLQIICVQCHTQQTFNICVHDFRLFWWLAVQLRALYVHGLIIRTRWWEKKESKKGKKLFLKHSDQVRPYRREGKEPCLYSIAIIVHHFTTAAPSLVCLILCLRLWLAKTSGARQAQILSLVGEIWHIILSSHPLRIKFAVQLSSRSVPHWLAPDCGKVKHKLFTGNLSSQGHTAPEPSGEH